MSLNRLLQRKTNRHSLLPVLRTALYLALLAAFLVQPVIHHHPLQGTSSNESSLASQSICAICAVGTDNIVLTAAPFVAPTVDSHPVVVLASASPSAGSAPALAARAPPSC